MAPRRRGTVVKAVEVRAVYRAAKVAGQAAPYDNLTLKIHYPCRYSDSFEERDTGFVPPHPDRSPLPVVVIMPGINISQESYGWLARRLAKAGFAALTYSWVTVEIAGRESLSPGVQLDRLRRENYGQGPSCPALPAIFDALQRVQASGLLAGHLDLSRIVLGGHSAGGSMALLNANRDWFPNLCGAFAYAAHTAGNLQLGWEAGSIMPIASNLPLLLMGGSRDGVIAASGHRYRQEGGEGVEDPVQRTFREGMSSEGGRRHLLLVEGANHFSFVWPKDESTGRAYLDRRAKLDGKKVRKYLGQAIVRFCRQVCLDDAASAAALGKLCNPRHPLAAVAQSK